MKQKILFRTITNFKKGYGNLQRSITLAEGLHKKDYQSHFLITKNTSAINELKKRHYNFSILPRFNSIKNESIYISNLMKSKNFQIIILDMREFGESLSKYLKQNNRHVVLIDDAWCKIAYADLLINGTIIEKYHNYKKINKNSKIFIGIKYFIIPNNFKKFRKQLYNIKQKKNYDIVVSMGGSDYDNITEFVVDSLIQFDNLRIKIIVGPFFKKYKKFKKYIKNKNIKIIKSSTTIWKEFNKADIAISASGNTLYELIVQRIPTLSISISPHQIPYAKKFQNLGCAIHLGYKNQITAKKIQNSVINLLKNTTKRRKMASISGKTITGDGLTNVISILDKFLKNKIL